MENHNELSFNEQMLLEDIIMDKMVEYKQLSEKRKDTIIPLGCSCNVDRKQRDNNILANDIMYTHYCNNYKKYSKIYDKISSLVTM